MTRIFVIVLLLLTSTLGLAQRVSPQVTNLAGADLKPLENLLITQAVGEVAITTLSAGSYFLTQGFLQPLEIETPCEDAKLDYYPNPAQDELTVELLGCEATITDMQLIDLWGRVITTIKPTKDNKVYIGNISPGVYFIKVLFSNNTSETIKIAKISN